MVISWPTMARDSLLMESQKPAFYLAPLRFTKEPLAPSNTPTCGAFVIKMLHYPHGSASSLTGGRSFGEPSTQLISLSSLHSALFGPIQQFHSISNRLLTIFPLWRF